MHRHRFIPRYPSRHTATGYRTVSQCDACGARVESNFSDAGRTTHYLLDDIPGHPDAYQHTGQRIRTEEADWQR